MTTGQVLGVPATVARYAGHGATLNEGTTGIALLTGLMATKRQEDTLWSVQSTVVVNTQADAPN